MSVRRNKLLSSLWTLVNFGLSSCFCIVIDKGIFTLVCLPLEKNVGRALAIVVAIIVARAVSGNINYLYNQRLVFKKKFTLTSYAGYWGLVAANVCLSMLATEITVALLDAQGIGITVVNFVVDVCLFFFSFTIQRFFIFRR